MSSMMDRTSSEGEPAAVGARLKKLRQANGLSIRELARRSGLTHAAISLIERDRSSPSVSSLKAMLDALGTTISAFFAASDIDDTRVIYRASELVELADGHALSYRQVGHNLAGAAMMLLHERYEPGADTGDKLYQHSAEEGGIVVSGRLELTVDREVHILAAGDAYYFDSRRPHRMHNPFDEPCVVVSAVSPPTF